LSRTIYRPLADAGEYNRFAAFPMPASGVGARAKTFEEYLEAGDYTPGRLWIAERDGEIVARIAFWAPEGGHLPWSVDYFDFADGDVEVGTGLMRAAYAALVPPDYSVPPHPEGGRPDYHLFLPLDWQERAAARRDAAVRLAAAERFGLVRFVERLNLRWTIGDGLPPRPTRLRFEPAADRYDELVDVVMRVNENTLDAHARRDIERWGPRSTVERMIADADGLPHGNRDWWRLAYTPSGSVVGFTMPIKVPTPTLWYVGVVPEHRGHRYCDDLVAETLHIVTEAGEDRMQDATDVANAPMAATFARCGYTVVGRRIILV
jgi:ribosomal protein S18 acetylase RimI-like enzyme